VPIPHFCLEPPSQAPWDAYSAAMDRIDRQIVHCLQRDARASFRRIADVLDVSEQTVARRYRSLRGDGAIRVLALPDPRAAGAQLWFVRIRCRPDAADSLADVVARREDVSWVSVTAGGGELTCVTSADPASPNGSVLLHRLPRTSQVLSFSACFVLHIHAGGDAEWLAFDDPLSQEQIDSLLAEAPDAVPDLVPTGVLRADDEPLLRELALDGRAGVVALARATGWPTSRVSSRLEELLGTGAVYADIDLAPQQFGFHSTAYLWLTVAPADLAVTGEALSRYPETSFAAAVTGAENLMIAVTCRDADALYSYVTTKVGSLAAVRQAEIVPVLRRVKQAGTQVRGGRLVVG
jgi:DNA-binding Lrp family transcriptional regulator